MEELNIDSFVAGVNPRPPKMSREERWLWQQNRWRGLPYGVGRADATGEIIHFDRGYRPLLRITAAGAHVICDGSWIDCTPFVWHYGERDLPFRYKRTRDRLNELMDQVEGLRTAVEIRRNDPAV